MKIDGTVSPRFGMFPGFADGIQSSSDSGLFSDALENASKAAEENQDKISLSADTAAGDADSTGALTDAQKQYLKDKYHLTDLSNLSQSEFNSILADLNQMGVLSDQDYQQANLRPVLVGPNGIGMITTRNASDNWLSPSDSFSNAFGYYQQMDQEEQQQIQYAEEHWGLTPSDPNYDRVSENLAAHQRIENLLESLFN
jgi:sugar/nucleoside kinase (ribokinase family)